MEKAKAKARLRTRMVRAITLLLLCLGLAAPTAQAARGNREANTAPDGQEQLWLRKQRGNARNDDRGDAARRAQRLSPEERLQLRRDIRDAGRELYPRDR